MVQCADVTGSATKTHRQWPGHVPGHILSSNVPDAMLNRAVKDIDDLAQSVVSARIELDIALQDRRRRPRREFEQLVLALTAYVNATAEDKMIHRAVAAAVSGLREYLESQGRQVLGDALFDADRLETMLFAGYDPRFEGDEPPGL